MRSRIFAGHVSHVRREPVIHRFRYPLYMLGLDLDELPTLASKSRLFSHNGMGLLSIHDRDYLDGRDTPIRRRIEEQLLTHGIDASAHRIMLVTMPRIAHMAFNPISFHYGFDGDDRVRWIVAEVNNTFGERHLYLLDELTPRPDGRLASNAIPKAFHVSPFFDMSGHYRFAMPDLTGDLDVGIELMHDGRSVLQAQLSGESLPMNHGNLLRTVVCYPFDTVMTMPRIIIQAAKLKLKRRLPVYAKPPANDPMTIRRAP